MQPEGGLDDHGDTEGIVRGGRKLVTVWIVAHPNALNDRCGGVREASYWVAANGALGSPWRVAGLNHR